jgi:hypothetical protein
LTTGAPAFATSVSFAGDVGLPGGAATGLAGDFATATTGALRATGFGAGFFDACFFATGLRGACFFAAGLREADFGAFLWTGFRDFADDLRTGFLAMGILNGAAAAGPGAFRAGGAPSTNGGGAGKPQILSCGCRRTPGPIDGARGMNAPTARHNFQKFVGETVKRAIRSAADPQNASLSREDGQNGAFFGDTPRKQRPAKPNSSCAGHFSRRGPLHGRPAGPKPALDQLALLGRQLVERQGRQGLEPALLVLLAPALDPVAQDRARPARR